MELPGKSSSPARNSLHAAETLILRWDSTDEHMILFDGDRHDVDHYLAAVDLICSSSSSSSSSSTDTIRLAMARLEDEFRHILSSRSSSPEMDSLSLHLSSLSFSDCASEEDPETPRRDDDNGSGSEGGVGGGSFSLRRKSSSGSDLPREIEMIPPESISDLRSISVRMISAGYDRECIQAFASIRKPLLDSAFFRLGIERLSIGDVQRLDWPTVESLISKWIHASRVCVRLLFASEKRLCDLVFDGDSAETCFAESARSAASRLFGFADAISISRRSSERLFRILDLHDAVSDLMPDIELVFCSAATESIRVQAEEILSRLGEAAKGMLIEFENAIQRETSRTPVPGGTIHPLTRYVMNYISLICDYSQTLTHLITTQPRYIATEITPEPTTPDLLIDDDAPPLAKHLLFIAVLLHSNLEDKSHVYKDPSLSHLFLMNNLHYIVQKIKNSTELRRLIGDDWLRKQTGKVRQHATGYQRATWVKILGCLRDEGLHVSGGFSSGVSKTALRERFKGFNAAFEEAHRAQAMWQVPDPQLREELRISVAEKLLPAYRAFLGRFRNHIDGAKEIKYSVDDLEMALSDFFEGTSISSHHRRRSHG